MYCQRCGQPNKDDAALCVRCGQGLAPIHRESEQVRSYLAFAIIVAVRCCLPAGIPAIVYAARVSPRVAAGDMAGAREASDKARIWCWIGAGLGLVGTVAYVAFMVLTTQLENR